MAAATPGTPAAGLRSARSRRRGSARDKRVIVCVLMSLHSGARAEEKRRERLVVVVRDAVLRQAGDFAVAVEADRGHVAEQFVDDAPLLLRARTQDLLPPGEGNT